MLIWSVIPNDIIWQIDAKEKSSQTKVVCVNGTHVMVDVLAQGKGRIRQIMSTNPSDFLREDLMPGVVISLPS